MVTHSLGGKHFVDGVIVLLGQDGQLPGLLLLQPLEHGLVLGLWCSLKQMVPERLVLPGLGFTRLLELLLNLQLLGLNNKNKSRTAVSFCVYASSVVT